MRKNYLFILLFVCVGFKAFPQAAACDGTRYQTEIFSGFTSTLNLDYGSNLDLNGAATALKLDIYVPEGDTVSERPVIVLIHGGTFIGGSRTGSDVKPPAERFSKMGYVAVSIQYRLGLPFAVLDSVDIIEATLRGVHDAKAAVRYLYKDRQGANLYKLDTNQIYLLGVSAGGIVALHYAYLDDIAELPMDVDTTKVGLGGGMEGLSGNPGYSSKIQGVANISGALGHVEWMQSGDEPVVSIHDPADGTVPYGTALASVFTFPLMVVDGSASVHVRAEELGIPNCFYTEYGGGHAANAASTIYTDTLMEVVSEFFQGIVCGTTPVCADFTAGIEDNVNGIQMNVFPNPSTGSIRIELDPNFTGKWAYTLTDLSGKSLAESTDLSTYFTTLDRNGLSTGMYLLKVTDGVKSSVRRVIFE